MFLYYDSKGVLKEIINDSALRQGDFGNDNIYIYMEGITTANIGLYHVWIRFQKNNGSVSAEMEVPQSATPVVAQIPPDKKRDLRYFKYYTDYPFFVVPFSQDLTLDEPGIDPDAYDYDMLDTAGSVALTVRLVTLSIKVLGLIVFNVEKSAEDLTGTVDVEEYLSLAQWNYLLARWTSINSDVVHITGDETIEGEKTFDAAVRLDNNFIFNLGGGEIIGYVDENTHYTYELPNEGGTFALLEVVRRQTVIGNTTYEFNDGVIEVPLSNFGTSVNGIYFITFGNAQASFVLTDDMVDLSTTYRIRIPCCVPKSDYSSSVGQLTIRKSGTNLLFYVNTIGGTKIEDGFQATIIKTGLM